MSPKKKSAKQRALRAAVRAERRASQVSRVTIPQRIDSSRVPKRLFKYTKSEYADAMVRHGTVRIGTLHEFRDPRHGPAISDDGEGHSETRHDVNAVFDPRDPRNRSWVMDEQIAFGPDVTSVSMIGTSFVAEQNLPDFYLYCTTKEFSERAMAAFNANACIEITDPIGFVLALDRGLRGLGMVDWTRAGSCDYGGRSRTHTMDRVDAALVKDPRYAYQKEYRIVMRSAKSGPLHPFFPSIAEITPFLRRHT